MPTTLVVAAAFTPVKNRWQSLVDRYFKERDPARELRAFRTQVRAVLQTVTLDQLLRRFLAEAVDAFDARSGAMCLRKNGQLYLAQSHGEWHESSMAASYQVGLTAALRNSGEDIGQVASGARYDGLDRTDKDREIFQRTVEEVATLSQSPRP